MRMKYSIIAAYSRTHLIFVGIRLFLSCDVIGNKSTNSQNYETCVTAFFLFFSSLFFRNEYFKTELYIVAK